MAIMRINREHTRLIMTGLSALLISSLAAMYAGINLGEGRSLLALIPGLMVLVPPTIGLRGNIAGTMASRLSSSIHLGEFEASIRRGSVLGDNLWASFGLTVILGFFVGVASYVVSLAFGLPVIGLLDLALISLVTAIISGILIMAFSVVISLLCYRLKLDLDMIAAPTVTTAGDIVTIPVLILVAGLIVGLPGVIRWGLFTGILICCTVLLLVSGRQSERVREIESQSLIVLLPLTILPTLAGIVYSTDLDALIAFAAILILIPSFAGGCGSIGGILCSRLSTLMHTGLIDPTPVPSREAAPEFWMAYLYTLILLPFMGAVAHIISQILHLPSPGLVSMVTIATIAGVLLMTLVMGVAYLTAALSFRYGYDPDNYGIPVVTGIIDLTGAMILMGVIQMMI